MDDDGTAATSIPAAAVIVDVYLSTYVLTTATSIDAEMYVSKPWGSSD